MADASAAGTPSLGRVLVARRRASLVLGLGFLWTTSSFSREGSVRAWAFCLSRQGSGSASAGAWASAVSRKRSGSGSTRARAFSVSREGSTRARAFCLSRKGSARARAFVGGSSSLRRCVAPRMALFRPRSTRAACDGTSAVAGGSGVVTRPGQDSVASARSALVGTILSSEQGRPFRMGFGFAGRDTREARQAVAFLGIGGSAASHVTQFGAQRIGLVQGLASSLGGIASGGLGGFGRGLRSASGTAFPLGTRSASFAGISVFGLGGGGSTASGTVSSGASSFGVAIAIVIVLFVFLQREVSRLARTFFVVIFRLEVPPRGGLCSRGFLGAVIPRSTTSLIFSRRGRVGSVAGRFPMRFAL